MKMCRRRTRRTRTRRRNHAASFHTPETQVVSDVGTGPYCYVRVSRYDGSIEVFRFETRAEAEHAMAEGVAQDAALCGGLEN
jgi:hypothetical protein